MSEDGNLTTLSSGEGLREKNIARWSEQITRLKARKSAHDEDGSRKWSDDDDEDLLYREVMVKRWQREAREENA